MTRNRVRQQHKTVNQPRKEINKTTQSGKHVMPCTYYNLKRQRESQTKLNQTKTVEFSKMNTWINEDQHAHGKWFFPKTFLFLLPWLKEKCPTNSFNQSCALSPTISLKTKKANRERTSQGEGEGKWLRGLTTVVEGCLCENWTVAIDP